MTLSRRHLLAGAATAVLWPRQAFAASSAEIEAMLGLLPDRAGAARLGAIWAAEARKAPDEVLENLRPRLRWSTEVDVTTIRHNLANAIADDFRNGAVVKVEGWQIARTQVELCALAYFATTDRL